MKSNIQKARIAFKRAQKYHDMLYNIAIAFQKLEKETSEIISDEIAALTKQIEALKSKIAEN